jgi:hypothetical protein
MNTKSVRRYQDPPIGPHRRYLSVDAIPPSALATNDHFCRLHPPPVNLTSPPASPISNSDRRSVAPEPQRNSCPRPVTPPTLNSRHHPLFHSITVPKCKQQTVFSEKSEPTQPPSAHGKCSPPPQFPAQSPVSRGSRGSSSTMNTATLPTRRCMNVLLILRRMG